MKNKTGSVSIAITIGALFVMVAGCEKNNKKPMNIANPLAVGIIGGEEVQDEDLLGKSIVAVVHSKNGSSCTGSVFSENLIITAGHCVDKENPKMMSVIFGSGSLTSTFGPVIRRVTDLRLNPRYEEVMAMGAKDENLNIYDVKEHDDIAILKFEGSLPSGYRPAEFLPADFELKAGMIITVAGFGSTVGVDYTPSNGLRKANLPLVDPNYSRTEVTLDQRTGKAVCVGDSGGPAFAVINGKAYLFGVNSRGQGTEEDLCNQFFVSTRISRVIPFITAAVSELNGNSPGVDSSVSSDFLDGGF